MIFFALILILICSDQFLLATEPSGQPSSQPTTVPTSLPTSEPSAQPSSQPSSLPTLQPSGQPTSQPSGQPSSQPSGQPSSQPTTVPTSLPTSEPSAQPSSRPSSLPTLPSGQPTSQPSGQPTNVPTSLPTSEPSSQPTSQPTTIPTCRPTGVPTASPTRTPISPSGAPTGVPSSLPSGIPTSQPSGEPTGQPTIQPSGQPSSQPSGKPTAQPSGQPSGQPTGQPTSCPSGQPTSKPSSSYVENIFIQTSVIFNFPPTETKTCASLNATDYNILVKAIVTVVSNGNKQLEIALSVNITGCNDGRRRLTENDYKLLDLMDRDRQMVTRAGIELDYTLNVYNPVHYGYTNAQAFQEDASTNLQTASDSGTLVQIIQQNPNSNLAAASTSIQGNFTVSIQVISTPTPTSAPTTSHPPTSAPTILWNRYVEVNDGIIDGTFGPMSALTDSFAWMIFCLTLGIVLGLSYAHYYVNNMDKNHLLINDSMKLRKEDRQLEKFQEEIYNSPNAHRIGHDFAKHAMMNSFEAPFSLPRLGEEIDDESKYNENNQSFKLEVSKHLRNKAMFGSLNGSALGSTGKTTSSVGSPKLKVRRGGQSRPWWHAHGDDQIKEPLDTTTNKIDLVGITSGNVGQQDQDNISIASSKFTSNSKASRRARRVRNSGGLGMTSPNPSLTSRNFNSGMDDDPNLVNYDDDNASLHSDPMEYSDIYSQVSDERQMEALSNMRIKKKFRNIQDKQKLLIELANTIQTLRKDCGMQPKISLTGSDVQTLFRIPPREMSDIDIDKLKILIKECKDEVNMLIKYRSELKVRSYDDQGNGNHNMGDTQSESSNKIQLGQQQQLRSDDDVKDRNVSVMKSNFKQQSDGIRSAYRQVNRSMKDRINESMRRKKQNQLIGDGNSSEVGDSGSVASSQRSYTPTPPKTKPTTARRVPPPIPYGSGSRPSSNR